MFVRRINRFAALVVATVVCSVATVTASIAPAHAAASGVVLMKGSGSAYTDNNGVNMGVIPGKASKPWSFKIVNTGLVSQQFEVTVATFGSGFTATLFNRNKPVSTPFTTPPVEAGASIVLTLKITIDAEEPQDEYIAKFELRDPATHDLLDSAFADANATYQTGTTQHDLFLKTGSQPYVGGSAAQFETAAAIREGQTAKFTIRLQNNGITPATLTLQGFPGFLCEENFVVTVKQGAKDFSAAVAAGVYSTGALDPGEKKQLKVSIKLVTDDDPGCTSDYFFFEAFGPDGNIGSAAHVVIAA
ncbi:hypothetical protein F0U44_07310 [Nocardioides humilatus]|uniref:DUF11 domain-containing protein n=1 Tax=Nocardioides humilatus TaxID=2607660 RepID=A0A5B1LHM7_9ACTN|nr:hypothetical protein [Nocardioides humilatus]KAA1420225.1 hypothetical protein F0U44_07310 [Nocardioides humilatus]